MKRLEDMSVAELKDHLASIRELNPHTYHGLNSYRIALNKLVAKQRGDE